MGRLSNLTLLRVHAFVLRSPPGRFSHRAPLLRCKPLHRSPPVIHINNRHLALLRLDYDYDYDTLLQIFSFTFVLFMLFLNEWLSLLTSHCG